MKLGKRDFTHKSTDLLFSTYAKPKVVLPKLPASFGYSKGIKDWAMLGNDKYGDCTCAGAGHEHMDVNHLAGREVSFNDADILALYSRVTGFNPADPSTDQGAVVRDVLSARKKIGVEDTTGAYHKIGAYLKLEPGNTDQLLMATYLFGAVGVGIQFPESAMDQFNAGKPWSVVKGAQIDGGHYIPAVAHRSGRINIVTWGRVQPMEFSFYRAYCDEAWAILSPEFLNAAGKTPAGFDLAQLKADLAAL